MMAWVSFWGAAQVFKNHPDYKNRTYADGSTPAEMAAAFDEYFRCYARERAAKGLLAEIASPTYAKYTLNTWYNLADFAEDPVLKQRMKMLLDLYWADWAIEQIDGLRGGSRHRCYTGRASTEGAAELKPHGNILDAALRRANIPARWAPPPRSGDHRRWLWNSRSIPKAAATMPISRADRG